MLKATPAMASKLTDRLDDQGIADGCGLSSQAPSLWRGFFVPLAGTMVVLSQRNAAMFRFSLRESILVTVIVGLCLGWWLDHRRLAIASENLFQLVATMNLRRMNLRKDERTGWWLLPGSSPHMSRIDGKPPEPSVKLRPGERVRTTAELREAIKKNPLPPGVRFVDPEAVPVESPD
jgi:hypothetical protein